MINLMDLPHPCLLQMLRNCDAKTLLSASETCVRMKKFAELQYSKCTKLELGFWKLKDKKQTTKLVKIFGKYVVDLRLAISNNCRGNDSEADSEADSEDDNDDYCNFSERFVSYVLNNFGANIRTLSISCAMCALPMDLFVRILGLLEDLKIKDYCEHYCGIEMDLSVLCPNLRRLEIEDSKQEFWLHSNRQRSFAMLEDLSLCVDFRAYEDNEFKQLIKQTPNLKRLSLFELADREKYVKLSDFALYLKNLEELSINIQLIIKMSPQRLLELSQLKSLRVLQLHNLNPWHLNEILKCISSTFQALTKVTIYVEHEDELNPPSFEANQQLILGIAIKLKDLRSFSAGNFMWNTETVMDFVRMARNLESISIDEGGIKVTPDFIRDIANARKDANHPKPLEVSYQYENYKFHKHTKYRCPNVYEIFQEPNVKRYLTRKFFH